MPTDRQKKGEFGEGIALNYLKNKGFSVCETNFRCRLGELDIVAKKGGEYYFVEVKTRWSDDFGDPLESITPNKQGQIIKAAKFYLTSKGLINAGCHLSAIGVDMSRGEPMITFIEDAFEAG